MFKKLTFEQTENTIQEIKEVLNGLKGRFEEKEGDEDNE